MATPFLNALHTIPAYKNAHITAYMRYGINEVLEGLTTINECITGKPSGITGPFTEARKLKSKNFNTTILLPNSWRMAFTTYLTGIKNRIGYKRNSRGIFLTDVIPCPTPGGWKEPISAVDYYLHIAKHLGAETSINNRIKLAISPNQEKQAQTILQQADLTIDNQESNNTPQKYVLLNPGAIRIDKRWPADNFIKLADYLAEKYNFKILINGSPAEADLVTHIFKNTKSPSVNLPQLGITLGTLKVICARCTLIISNDTGTRHIAAAIGNAVTDNSITNTNNTQNQYTACKMISLFGPTNPSWAKINYESETEIYTGGQPIDNITTQQVIETCDFMLNSI